MDMGNNSISNSMQLVAAQTALRYNKCKNRKGAFWEDRCHATADKNSGYDLRFSNATYKVIVLININRKHNQRNDWH